MKVIARLTRERLPSQRSPLEEGASLAEGFAPPPVAPSSDTSGVAAPGASLAPHVIAKLEEEFAKRATQEAGGGKALMPTVFSRFYCEMLFRHFDKDNNGTLELAEVSEALKYLVKPNADGVKVAPVVAYPPEFTTASGEVHLPIQWFWAHFSSME